LKKSVRKAKARRGKIEQRSVRKAKSQRGMIEQRSLRKAKNIFTNGKILKTASFSSYEYRRLSKFKFSFKSL